MDTAFLSVSKISCELGLAAAGSAWRESMTRLMRRCAGPKAAGYCVMIIASHKSPSRLPHLSSAKPYHNLDSLKESVRRVDRCLGNVL